jgi:hypothetical protein
MAEPDGTRGRHLPPENTKDERNDAELPVDENPAAQRGERLDAGKTIARGGHETGKVPGAEEAKP